MGGWVSGIRSSLSLNERVHFVHSTLNWTEISDAGLQFLLLTLADARDTIVGVL